jgi:ribonuclease P protein component
MSNRFYRAEHLKSRKTIADLFKLRQSVAAFPIRILWIALPKDTLFGYHQTEESSVKIELCVQAGFSVPKKKFKLAVARNRIKRQMREAYRLQKAELLAVANSKGKKIACMLLYADDKETDSELLHQKMQQCLRKLIAAI